MNEKKIRFARHQDFWDEKTSFTKEAGDERVYKCTWSMDQFFIFFSICRKTIERIQGFIFKVLLVKLTNL